MLGRTRDYDTVLPDDNDDDNDACVDDDDDDDDDATEYNELGSIELLSLSSSPTASTDKVLLYLIIQSSRRSGDPSIGDPTVTQSRLVRCVTMSL